MGADAGRRKGQAVVAYRIGNDIGGTFTDTVVWEEEGGSILLGKVLTTPEEPARGGVEGINATLRCADGRMEAVRHVIHGTTLITNAVIERKGVRTGFITTKGFRDIIRVGKEKRYAEYDMYIVFPDPLVPRRLRKEVNERLDPQGDILIPLDRNDVEQAVEELKQEGVEAIAVCLLHSFRNPEHERTVAEIIQRVAPEVSISLSVDVIPQIREYERSTTTIINAYTQPLLRNYLGSIEESLIQAGYRGRLYVMLSNGGVALRDTAEQFPVRVFESGPAAGVIATAFFGELVGERHLLSFDMGGTTAKAGIVHDGRPAATIDFEVARVQRFRAGSGFPVKLPAIDLIEIGAGGGSIAHIDDMGLLKVGPGSAGASPGPVCYGLGGTEPTVTDADLVLGHLNPEYFLGGDMTLDLPTARRILEEKIAMPLGVDVMRAAWGIHQVVDENMANAARVHCVEKGQDPSRFVLTALGGAGPLHAFWIAEKLGIRRVLYPIGAGAASALGFLTAPFSFDFVRTAIRRLDQLDYVGINGLLEEMEAEGRNLLHQADVPDEDITIRRFAEMRYVGQAHEIYVPVGNGVLNETSREQLRKTFDKSYEQLLHRTNVGYPVEALNWRVEAIGVKPPLRLKKVPRHTGQTLDDARRPSRPAYFPEHGGLLNCPVFDRYRLFEGAEFDGPAIIEERESTVVIGSKSRAVVDAHLNLLVTRQE